MASNDSPSTNRFVNPPFGSIACKKARSAIPAKQTSFPFMKLPIELRLMVYNYHFFQMVEHSSGRCYATYSPVGVNETVCASTGPICFLGITNKGVHPGSLWLASKTIYHEAMPIYFRNYRFHFTWFEDLNRFLTTIPYCHRQHITKISFGYRRHAKTRNFDIRRAFSLLSECPNLVELAIGVLSPELHRDTTPGLKTLLQTRGISLLEINYVDWDYIERSAQDIQERLVTPLAQRLSVLKEPYSPAEMKRRNARGIAKGTTILRTCFDGSETETRAARYERLKQLREIT
ncbi:MAG: hypothetical protein Q9221_003164 [Calogaya cf. arnoldii]